MTHYNATFNANSGIKQRACMRCMVIRELNYSSINLDRTLINNIYTVQVLGCGVIYVSEFTREPQEFKRNFVFNGSTCYKDDELIQKVVRYHEKHSN